MQIGFLFQEEGDHAVGEIVQLLHYAARVTIWLRLLIPPLLVLVPTVLLLPSVRERFFAPSSVQRHCQHRCVSRD